MHQRLLEQSDALIAQIEADEAQAPAHEQRGAPRYPFICKGLQIEFQPLNQSPMKLAVLSRNLSETGLCVIVDRFVYVGTRLSVGLPTIQNEIQVCRGTIDRCRYLPGSQQFYDVGIRFDQRIDPRHFQCSTPRPRILLIDDSAVMHALVLRILKHAGLDGEVAEDGDIGVERTLSGQYDVVLMDLDMPRVNGREATRTLREKNYLRPIIAATAAPPLPPRKLLGAGFDGFLQKPYRPSDLTQAISALITGDVTCSLPARHASLASATEFVGKLAARVRDIREHLDSDRVPELDRIAGELAAEAPKLGFEPIAEAATQLSNCIKASQPIEAAVGHLIRTCSAAR